MIRLFIFAVLVVYGTVVITDHNYWNDYYADRVEWAGFVGAAKDMKNFAKYRRNRFEPQAVEPIIYMINNSTDQQIRKAAADALGWYEYSSVRKNVLAECEKLYEVEKDEQVKAEFQKAINRLK